MLHQNSDATQNVQSVCLSGLVMATLHIQYERPGHMNPDSDCSIYPVQFSLDGDCPGHPLRLQACCESLSRHLTHLSAASLARLSQRGPVLSWQLSHDPFSRQVASQQFLLVSLFLQSPFRQFLCRFAWIWFKLRVAALGINYLYKYRRRLSSSMRTFVGVPISADAYTGIQLKFFIAP